MEPSKAQYLIINALTTLNLLQIPFMMKIAEIGA